MYNPEPIHNIADDFIQILECCLMHKDVYTNNKEEMLNIIRTNHPIFYSNYFRLCKTAVETDIGPLIQQMKVFYKVQKGEIDFNKAADIMNSATNDTYMNPVLYSDKLKEERKNKDLSNKKV